MKTSGFTPFRIPQEVARLLEGLSSTPDSYLKASRQIAALGDACGLVPLRIAIAASFTADLLLPYIQVEAARLGFRAVTYLAPYNQIDQELLETASPLKVFAPDVVFVAAHLGDLVPDLRLRLAGHRPEEARDAALEGISGIISAVHAARKDCPATFFVFNLCEPLHPVAGLADVIEPISEQSITAAANERLVEAVRATASIHVFDYRAAANRFGLSAWHDARMWFWARSPFTPLAMVHLGRQMARAAAAAVRPACKCLVLDCDNVLWGGVVGEEGLDGIGLGTGYPGSVYKDFQTYLKSLKGRGILLAIASKNNPGDVTAVFTQHPDMVLALDDFAVVQVHWDDKAGSIRAIARQLNVGLDAIAFFDDSPIEREWVRDALPEVKVIEAPADPLEYVQALADSAVFDQLTIVSEDRARHDLYRSERQRGKLREATGDVDDFLRRLGMVATVGPIAADNLKRVAQLLAKTNQFNLTLRRHSAPQIEALLDRGGLGLWMRLSDRFGDHGLIAAALAVDLGEATWEIDTFLMSCRVLGRGAELVLLHALMERCVARGATRIAGRYVAGPRNQQVADFYPSQGFRDEGNGRGLWDVGQPLPRTPEPFALTTE